MRIWRLEFHQQPERYGKALQQFLSFLEGSHVTEPADAEDADLRTMEFRSEACVTRSKHQTLVSAVEFFLPRWKGQLSTCREALKGKLLVDPIQHTVPMTPDCANLFSARLASEGKPRAACAPVIQTATGLRPSELNLCTQRFRHSRAFLSISAHHNRSGEVTSTKAKREQYTLLSR